MSNILTELLDENTFPIESDIKVTGLRDQVRSGNMGISLSSFEELFEMTPKSSPFPVGMVNFDDGKKRFVISWIDAFSKLNITEVEEYTLRVRHYPTDIYPVLSIIVGLHNGKVDPETEQDLWYYGEIHLDFSLLSNRIKLYQLVNSEEILFCLYDNVNTSGAENLDSYGFSLNSNELRDFADEIRSLLHLFPIDGAGESMKNFSRASKFISNTFHHSGLPKTQDALQVYLKRKSLKDQVTKHNWKEYLAI